MKIYFISTELKLFLESFPQLKAAYGMPQAKAVIKRIDNLKAADTLADLPPGARAHPLQGDEAGKYSITTKLPYALLIEPADEFSPENIRTVTAVTILKFGNYHK